MKRKEKFESETGFEGWGDYMDAKIAKLEDQFRHSSANVGEKLSNLFAGVSIFVNGYTNPSADELKRIMMLHGGVFHHYKRPTTTYTIASILPDVKVRSITSEIIISPRWVVDCLQEGRLLDYSRYLLYTQHKTSQPKLAFAKVTSSVSRVTDVTKPVPKNDGDPNDISRAECLNVLGMLKHFSDPLPDESVRTIGKEQNVESVVNEESCEKSSELTSMEIDCSSAISSSKDPSPLCSPDVFPEDEPLPTAETSVQTNVQTKSPSKSTSSKQSLKATDPNFLTEFFNNSRLHHIATLGASFKQYVAELREKSTGSFPARETLVQQLASNRRVQEDTDTLEADSNAHHIMHIDMDCFFVSVGLRKYPHLRGLPVAVTHSRGSEARVPSHPGQNRALEIELYHKRLGERYKAPDIPIESRLSSIDENNSLSEIASCSYEARRCGVKNGMFVGAALKLCPDLKTIPYDFEGYREVAHQLYDTIAQYTLDIEAVSCDEMFVDLTELLQATGLDVMEFVSYVRQQITTETGGCACSAGVGANRLQARMATKKAKPNGQFRLMSSAVEEYMRPIPIAELPGVGPSTAYRLKQMTYVTCADLQTIPKNVLQTEFGKKFGETLYNACRGIDERPLVYDRGRKSVSVDVNYGIRFRTAEEVDRFMRQLTEEIHRRLVELRQRGKLVTVKLLVRSPEAPIETAKFMGHGLCDVVTKSQPLRQYTDDRAVLETAVLSLMRVMAIEPCELRGIGIQISKFEGAKRAVDTEAGNRLRNMFQKAEEKRKPNTEQKEASVASKAEICRKLFKQPDDQEPCSSRSYTGLQQQQQQVPLVQMRETYITPTKALAPREVAVSPKQQTSPATSHSPSRKRGGVSKPPGTRGRRGRPPKWASLGSRKETQNASGGGLWKFLHSNETKANSSWTADLPAGLDPDVLAALPDDIRQEAIRDYRREQQLQLSANKPFQPPTEKTPVKSSPQRTVSAREWKSPIVPQETNPPVEDSKIRVDLKFLQALPLELRVEVEKQIELNKDQMVVTCSEPEIDEPLCVSSSPENSPVKQQTPKKDLDPVQTVVIETSKDPNILRRSNWRELIEEWVDSTEEPYIYDVELLASNGEELCENEWLERLYIFLRCLHRLVQEKRGACYWHRAYAGVVGPIQNRMLAIYGNKLAVPLKVVCELCNSVD
uniref:DNA repair protein REV1 n=1 Tax=Anopheles farauti TaxID=69004 RepID=A0A182QM37_9DIPT